MILDKTYILKQIRDLIIQLLDIDIRPKKRNIPEAHTFF